LASAADDSYLLFLVITDSVGIQEETSYLGIPCLTLRETTERPITVTHGTNQLCGLDDLKEKVNEILDGQPCRRNRIDFWDGKTAERIVAILRNIYNNGSAKIRAKKEDLCLARPLR